MTMWRQSEARFGYFRVKGPVDDYIRNDRAGSWRSDKGVDLHSECPDDERCADPTPVGGFCVH